MTLTVDVSTNGARAPIARARVADIARRVLRAEGVRHALLSIAFVSNRDISRVNREHLGHAGPTDVISFGFTRATPRDPVVGDVYIAPEVARRNAERAGVGVREELARLVVHGVLHVLGHEHPEGERREQSPMWRKQERLLSRVRRSRR
jgi:probable rRNA maturation factor